MNANLIRKITKRQMPVMIRYYYHGQKFPEIARILGISVKAVYRRHDRAIQALGFRPKRFWRSNDKHGRYCFTADVSSWD